MLLLYSQHSEGILHTIIYTTWHLFLSVCSLSEEEKAC